MTQEENAAADQKRTKPALKLNFLSHGTLESTDLDRARKFYEEFLGLEVVQTSPISLMIRLGGLNTIAVVKTPNKKVMSLLNHNGLDVKTREDVDECHRIVVEQQEKWGLTHVTKPIDQHGTYTFYFKDPDENWWEILTNPQGGYSWMFKKGEDIKNWGWNEDQGFNPNDSKAPQRGRAG